MSDPFQVGILSDLRSEVVTLLGPILAEIFEPLPYLRYEYFEPAGALADPGAGLKERSYET